MAFFRLLLDLKPAERCCSCAAKSRVVMVAFVAIGVVFVECVQCDGIRHALSVVAGGIMRMRLSIGIRRLRSEVWWR